MIEPVTTLVILDGDDAPPAMPEKASGGSAAILLTFSLDDAAIRDVHEVLTQGFAQVEVLSAARLLDDAALRVRPEYGRLVAEAPDRIRVGKKTLRQAFTFEGRLSLWYLSETFGKRSDVYPAFTRLCQLEVVRSLAATRWIGKCILLSRNQSFWLLIRDFCKQAGITFASPRPSEKPAIRSLLQILAGSLVWFATTLVQTILARRLLKKQPEIRTSVRPWCAFHTVFPLLWRGSNLEQDEKYGDTLKVMQTAGRLTPVYALSFIADGCHQRVNLKEFRGLSRWLMNRWRAPDVAVCLLDAYASVRDILRALLTISLVWKYYWLERYPSFQDHWRYQGISFFPFVREELRSSMLRTPRYLLHALRVRRFLNRTTPAALAYQLFDHNLGRAIAYGARTARTRPRLIGVQEGPAARRKLTNFFAPGELWAGAEVHDFVHQPPLPDLFLLEGKAARELLEESGFPAERLVVGGAPRLARLEQLPPRQSGLGHFPPRKGPGGKTVVLVAFGQHDAQPMLAACLPVLRSQEGFHFVFKLHPRGGKSSEEINQLLEGEVLTSSYAVKDADVYSLIPQADVILVTYTSVGMEAAARGYPVICLHLPNRLNPTPLLDREASGVVFVANSQELLAALAGVREAGMIPETAARALEEYFFYHLDGQSAHRWADSIMDTVRSSSGKKG